MNPRAFEAGEPAWEQTMTDWGRGGNRGQKRPPGPARGGPRRPGAAGSGSGSAGRSRRPGSISVRRVRGDEFELVHPRCVREREPDFEEGIELWKAGDPEGARDALRYALSGCGDNLWVHVALGRIALEVNNDPALARGHFGYAFELAERALPPRFAGTLPRQLAANRPLYDAIDGLAACYEGLDRLADAAGIRAQGARWAGAPRATGSAARRSGPEGGQESSVPSPEPPGSGRADGPRATPETGPGETAREGPPATP